MVHICRLKESRLTSHGKLSSGLDLFLVFLQRDEVMRVCEFAVKNGVCSWWMVCFVFLFLVMRNMKIRHIYWTWSVVSHSFTNRHKNWCYFWYWQNIYHAFGGNSIEFTEQNYSEMGFFVEMVAFYELYLTKCPVFVQDNILSLLTSMMD